MSGPALKLSRRMALINLIGALMLGLGLTTLMGEGRNLHLWLAGRLAGVPLCIAGLVLIGWFVFDLINRIRIQRNHFALDSFTKNETGKR